MAALRRPVRSARAGHAGKGQNVPEKRRAHKAAQARRPRRQSGAAPACRAGGQRRLSPGRAVQCAYFSTAGPDIPDISDKACFPCTGGGRAQKEIRAPYACNASNKGRLHTDVFLCAACLCLILKPAAEPAETACRKLSLPSLEPKSPVGSRLLKTDRLRSGGKPPLPGLRGMRCRRRQFRRR